MTTCFVFYVWYADYILVFSPRTLVAKGGRSAQSSHIQQQSNSRQAAEEEWEVESINAQRVFKGVTQYRVSWKGFPKQSWVSMQDLNCPELLEDWEIANEVAL